MEDLMVGEYHGHATLKDGSHVALTSDEAKALWEASERSAEDRAARMPSVFDALKAVSDAQQRMRVLGWSPGGGLKLKGGDECAVVEFGSTGIWSGWLDQDREYVYYAGCVASPRKVWLKPLGDLTDEERTKMEECDKDNREWMEGEFARWSMEDQQQ